MNPEDLDRIIAEDGVSDENAAKLRQGLAAQSDPDAQGKGHGAPGDALDQPLGDSWSTPS